MAEDIQDNEHAEIPEQSAQLAPEPQSIATVIATEEASNDMDKHDASETQLDTNEVDEQAQQVVASQDETPANVIKPTSATLVVTEENEEKSASITQSNTGTTEQTHEHEQLDSPPESNTQIDSNNVTEELTYTAALDSPNPQNKGFPKDFNWTLFEQNQTLQQEHTSMTSKLKAKEDEIVHLEEALTTLHEELKFLESQEVQSVAKDLAKKNRRLTVHLERARSRTAQLEIEKKRLLSELERYSHHHLSPRKTVEPLAFSHRELDANDDDNNNKNADTAADLEEEEDKSVEVQNKKDKDDRESRKEHYKNELQVLTHKWLSAKNENIKHKDAIKKLKLVIRKELGLTEKDDISMTKVNDMLRETASWKGRAEKVAILQSKLDDVTKQMEMLGAVSASSTADKPDRNDAYKQQIARMSVQRAREFENAQIGLSKLNDVCDELRQTIKGKSARISGLEKDASSFRNKLSFFVEKSKNDDQLIEKLYAELEKTNALKMELAKKQKTVQKKTSTLQALQQQTTAQAEEIKSLQHRLQASECELQSMKESKVEQLQQCLQKFNEDEKQHEINVLKAENGKLTQLIATYKQNLSSLQKRLSRKASPRMDNSRGAHSNNTILQLKDKMQTMIQEQQLIKASYLSIIQGKNDELEICQKMLDEQRSLYQHGMAQLNQQFEDIKQRILRK